MDGLFKLHHSPALASVDLQEDVVLNAKHRIKVAMNSAVEPLIAYIATYDQYKQLFALDIDEWFESFKAREFSVAVCGTVNINIVGWLMSH